MEMHTSMPLQRLQSWPVPAAVAVLAAEQSATGLGSTPTEALALQFALPWDQEQLAADPHVGK